MYTRISLLIVSTCALAACDSGSGPDPVTTVNLPPSIGAIGNKQTTANAPSEAFDVGITDESPDQVTLTASSDNEALIPSERIELGGSGARRTLVVDPIEDVTGEATITVVATDAQGRSSERSFAVTVAPEQRSLHSFTRDSLSLAGDGAPQLINAVNFEEDAEHDDFADLFE